MQVSWMVRGSWPSVVLCDVIVMLWVWSLVGILRFAVPL